MKRLDPYLPVVGVVGLIAVWYLAVWKQVVDPVLAKLGLTRADLRRKARREFTPNGVTS